ncbi:cold shock protein [Leifsonia xyli subsp. cynodontis DSM 46306]|uniref:Scaffolding protein n=1 Tax=Leifsonia xyli subsp. cynodontis DSM 46306 TaxID=1389489 RepID=U3P8E0_LEIXC|nr:DUF4355 domain-containing protein [Leifsonia xyli]AGW41734.1 cold shock protein [Leifsonia xyli subsp. cynodontis DSM 46306]AGW42257.1 cold shock protein [Leifsonia xyli subsp. cynodontis DSM 46306]
MPDPTEPVVENNEPVVENDGELGDAGKRAIAAERKRAEIAEKSLKALQEEITKRENAELSELERFKKENEELRNNNSTSSLEATRYKVALEKGIPVDLAGRLQGSNYEELAADADTLVSLLPAAGAPVKQTPRPDPSQGAKRQHAAASPREAFGDALKSALGRS